MSLSFATMPPALRFGLSLPADKKGVDEALVTFGARLGAALDQPVIIQRVTGYEILADEVRAASVDFAWLPPVAYLRLGEAVRPLARLKRTGAGGYETGLVTRGDSNIHGESDLRHTRAAWIDPWSASGFIVPRMALMERGIDPRKLFRAEAFYGSHQGALTALKDGAADVAGTYLLVDDAGAVTSGGWAPIDGLEARVVARFGVVPSDLIAGPRSIDDALATQIVRALESANSDPALAEAMTAIFNTSTFEEANDTQYEGLRTSLAHAESAGLFGS